MRVTHGSVTARQSLSFNVNVKGNLSAPLPESIASLDNVKEFYSKKDIEKDYNGQVAISDYICDFCLDDLFPDYDLEVDEYYLWEDGEKSMFEIGVIVRPEVNIVIREGGYEENTYQEDEIIDAEEFCLIKEKDFKNWKKELIDEINSALKISNISPDLIFCEDMSLIKFEEPEYDIRDVKEDDYDEVEEYY